MMLVACLFEGDSRESCRALCRFTNRDENPLADAAAVDPRSMKPVGERPSDHSSFNGPVRPTKTSPPHHRHDHFGPQWSVQPGATARMTTFSADFDQPIGDANAHCQFTVEQYHQGPAPPPSSHGRAEQTSFYFSYGTSYKTTAEKTCRLSRAQQNKDPPSRSREKKDRHLRDRRLGRGASTGFGPSNSGTLVRHEMQQLERHQGSAQSRTGIACRKRACARRRVNAQGRIHTEMGRSIAGLFTT